MRRLVLAACLTACATSPAPPGEAAPALAADGSAPELDGEPGAAPALDGELDADSEAAAAAAPRAPVSARVTTTYRGRLGDGDQDHDVTETVDVDVGDPRADPVTFHALVHGALDLDGDDADGDFAFYSLADTYDHRLTGRIHHLYADVHADDGLALLRVGRQLLYDTPETLHLDGVLLETEPLGARALRVGAWGGVPALAYESSREGDLAAGAYAAIEAAPALTLRADVMHLEDGEDEGDDDDDLLALEALWRPSPTAAIEASHGRLGADPRDVEALVRWLAPARDLAVEARYYELLRTEAMLATPLDPFFTTLFEQHPFREASLAVTKGFERDVYLAAGISARRVADQDDVGAFNRDFARWYATASSEDLLPRDVTLALTAEVWDGEGDRFETWGVDLSRELGDGWRVDAGSFYSLYKYVLYLDEEREDVRTWYAGVRRRVSARLSWRARYELEDNDLDDFHTVRVGITWQL